MTGFGTAAVAVPGGRLVAEVRSVNARFLELRINLPREHQAAESELREIVQRSVERGRVDVVVRREGTARISVRVEPDLELARASGGDLLRSVQGQPDVEKELPLLRRVVAQAISLHAKDRQREGANLAKDMKERWKALVQLHKTFGRLAHEMMPLLTERLTARVTALIGEQGVDEGRVLQEVALAVERSAINEELARLGSHLDALAGLLKDKAAIGKRLEFLIQELVREVNTIGSKANHLPMTQAVLAAKSEIEKLREQTANVE
jgi:uncharacterized protein YicC (UPF0701 family)